jgi:hypothetical protein
MKDLKEHLNETLFDGKGLDTKKLPSLVWLDNFYKYINDNRSRSIKNNRNFTVEAKEDGLYVTQLNNAGCLGLEDFKSKKAPELMIKYFDGKFYIIDSDIDSFEGIFAPDCEFHGMLIIYGAKNIKNLIGLPARMSDSQIMGVPELHIDECPSLKSFEGLPAGLSIRHIHGHHNGLQLYGSDATKELKKYIKR